MNNDNTRQTQPQLPMKTPLYRPAHFIILMALLGAVSFLWLLLGGTVTSRAVIASQKLAYEVEGNWGPALAQGHPAAKARTQSTGESRGVILPESSVIDVKLDFQPQKKGLITHRTYSSAMTATYTWRNPDPVDLTMEVGFQIPGSSTRIEAFKLSLDDRVIDEAPADGKVELSFPLPAGTTKTMRLEYSALGKDSWLYHLAEGGKAKNFQLTLTTNCHEYNVPIEAESPTRHRSTADGMTHEWAFANITGVETVGIEMPSFVDAAKVAARMSFFGPLSLGLFFSVLVIAAMRMGIFLHVAHFGLLAAACFAFQLLFAYSVDVLPAVLAFIVAAAVTMGLVGFYLYLIAGKTFTRIAMVAQAAYIVLFNATFFFDGYTGLTLTIVGIITLGLVMGGTAKMDWSNVMDFGAGKNPPPLPTI